MIRDNPHAPRAPSTTRETILAAAEHLLGEGRAEFSMRDLATAAGVSFATPFNQFGSKLAIMRALSAQRIERMHARSAAIAPTADAPERVLQVMAIAAAVMTDMPDVNKAVMGAIGAPGGEPGDVQDRSRALWAGALGDGTGLASASRDLGLAILPDQLAIAFRGALSFWTAGEIPNEALRPRAIGAAATLLLGFVDEARRVYLTHLIGR